MRGSFAGLCLLTLAGRAEAFEARRRFAIDSKPYAEARIDLAVQGNVSLLGASACGAGGSSALAGRYTLSEALARMLAGAPCAWKVVDAHTVRITPVTPTPRDTPPAPCPAPPPLPAAQVRRCCGRGAAEPLVHLRAREAVPAVRRCDLVRSCSGCVVVSRSPARACKPHDTSVCVYRHAPCTTPRPRPAQ